MTGTVLILGAAGRCGRAAARAFRQAGWRVRVQVRPGRAAPAADEIVACDATNAVALAKAAGGADVIVHALNPPYPAWARELPRLTRAVIAAACASGAAVMIPGNVYNYGSELPEVLDEATPHRPDTRKGRLRAGMEADFRDAGVRTIVLRGGDFLENSASGNWFDAVIARNVARGRMTYPGPTDRPHAWAYLPDFARALVGLAERRADLAVFEDVGFPGNTLTGRELADAMARAAGRPMRIRPFLWWAIALASPVWPMGRELREMAYLWRRPHRIEGAKLARLLRDFRPTDLDAAMANCLGSADVHPDQAMVGARRSLAADQPV